jgi:hypothetical protein
VVDWMRHKKKTQPVEWLWNVPCNHRVSAGKYHWWQRSDQSMPYKIERKRNGLVKHFSGVVTFDDVLASEQAVISDPVYTSLQYVISDYICADYRGITDAQKDDVNALRIGGHLLSNKAIKYAFVIQNPEIRAQIMDAVESGDMPHQTQIFDTYEQAAAWVGL